MDIAIATVACIARLSPRDYDVLMEPIIYKPIGIIHSPYPEPYGTPIQGRYAPSDLRAEIEIFDEYAEGLKDIDGFSHIYVLFHMHLSKSWELIQKPFLDDIPRGVFAIRSPQRPNPIGLSVVRLVERKKNILIIAEFDMLDGSPVLDIKPYIPEFEDNSKIRTGWSDEKTRNRKPEDYFTPPKPKSI